VWGEVPKDGIPDMINLPVVTPPDAGYLFDEDRVFGVSFNGEHRAYPLRILNAHEMANDGVGACLSRWPGAYRTLCGSGIVYYTKIDRQVFEFGTSGLLYRSNKLMYDRGTETL
jgi:hypothetical protein